MIINFDNVKYEIGAEIILSDVSFSVAERDKIGVIGPNGGGKTTLLKLICGENTPSDGNLFIVSSKTMGYVAQNSGLNSEKTVTEEFLEPFAELVQLEKKIEETEKSEGRQAETLASLYEKFEKNGGLTYKSRINAVLTGLGFPEESRNLKISSLSEGQKTKLALGRALIANPDILLLDEPTNHLDMDSVIWLENDLKKFKGTLIVVSHDRTLLNNVTNRTLFVEFNRVDDYPFAYEKATEVRNEDRKYIESCYQKQQRQIEKIKAFIKQQQQWNRERNIIAAESRMKKLDRMTIIERPAGEQDPPAIKFETDEHGCKDVLLLKNVGFAFPGRRLFSGINLDIKRGERIFLMGKNGCGKSTLLKIITGEIKDYEGRVKLGENLEFSYYRQNMDDLDPEKTVFDEIWDHANGDAVFTEMVSATKIRNALGAFNFSGEDVFKKISALSGGEKARVSMLKICFNRSGLLILDEPTNHLDIRTRETLEKAILDFKGTVIAVSHDRYFVSKLATRTVDMNQYIPEEKQEEKSTKNKDDYFRTKEQQSNERKMKTAIQRLEKGIAENEQAISEIEKQLSDPEISADYEKILSLCGERDRLTAETDKMYEELFNLTT